MRHFIFALCFAFAIVTGTGCITSITTPRTQRVILFPSPPVGVDAFVCVTCNHNPCCCRQVCEDPWRWTCEVCGRQWGREAESWEHGGRKVCRYCHYERWERDRDWWQCSMCSEKVWSGDVVMNDFRGYRTCLWCASGDYCSNNCRLSHPNHHYRPYGYKHRPPYQHRR